MTIGNFSELVGTAGFDSLTGNNLEIVYGAGNNDSLVSGVVDNPVPSINILVGGTGRNLYSVRNNSTAIIIENSDSEENVLFTNIVAAGINPEGDSFVAAEIADRHLYIGDDNSQQYVLLLDWQQSANRIEEFHFANEVLDYETFVSSYRDLSGYQGHLSFNEFVGRFNFPVAELGIATVDSESLVDTIIARSEEIEVLQENTASPIVPDEPRVADLGNFVEVLGIDGYDSISGNDLQIVYGLEGDDVLNSYPNFGGGELADGGETTILVGGSGENDYQLRPNSTAIIVENGAGEGNILWTTIQSSGIGLDKETSFFIEIDNRHLYLGDTASNQRAILLDWQEDANQIESFDFVGGNISYEDFADGFRDVEGYGGNVTWDELELDFERLGLDTAQIEDTFSQIRDRSEELENPSTVEFFRFRNTGYETGTYIFVAEAERDGILSDTDLSDSFELEGRNEDTVNSAFTASLEAEAGMLPFYRLSSLSNPGTYLYVSTEEYEAIFAEDSNQKDLWLKEGVNAEEDIAEFYLHGVGAETGVAFNRFQNRDNGTFLFTAPEETTAINNNPDLAGVFIDQGVAFHAL